MKFVVTRHFKKCYKKLPTEIKEITSEKLALMSRFPEKHPSLRIKKVKGTDLIWEASITMNYRVTFQLAGDTILLRKIGKHDETLSKP